MDGVCQDSHAKPTPIMNEKCECVDGYVSSNGGKLQTQADNCVPCILSEFCSFEGGICDANNRIVCGFGENSCIGNRCRASVSLSSHSYGAWVINFS